MAEKTYWLGKGQVRIDGRLHRTGAEIPIDKVTDKKRKEWEADGVIGSAPFHHKAGRPTNDIKLLQDRIIELKSELEEKDNRIYDLESQLEEAKAPKSRKSGDNK